jgi:hypothetical protein
MLMLGTSFTAVGFLIHDIAFGDVNRAGAMATSAGDQNSFHYKYSPKRRCNYYDISKKLLLKMRIIFNIKTMLIAL